MIPLRKLKFDNANNSCMSFHVIAEMVRTGDVVLVGEKHEGCDLTITVRSPTAERKPACG